MPAIQRGQVYRLKGGRFGVRYYDEYGVRHKRSPFPTRKAAHEWFDTVERPRQYGQAPPEPDRTFSVFVAEFLEAKRGHVEPVTVRTLGIRLAYAERVFGQLTLRELERRPREIAKWAPTLGGMRYPVLNALRQALDVAVSWGLLERNPAKLAGPNPQPKAREVQPFSLSEIDAIADEIREERNPWAQLVVLVAETGLRPEEWIALERRDVRRAEAALLVERVFTDGAVKLFGKTDAFRRRVPLTPRALEALESMPARIDTPILFPAAKGGYLNLHNWRSREWYPALESAGLAQRGPYALRHTYVTHALAAGVPTFSVARFTGMSVEMIERTYGHLAATSEQDARTLLAAYAQRQQAADSPTFGPLLGR